MLCCRGWVQTEKPLPSSVSVAPYIAKKAICQSFLIIITQLHDNYAAFRLLKATAGGSAPSPTGLTLQAASE